MKKRVGLPILFHDKFLTVRSAQSAYSPLSLPPIYDDYELESVSKEHDFPPLPSGAPPNKRRFSTTKKEDTRSHSVKAPDSPCVSLALRKSQTLSNSLNAPKISLSTHISSKTRSSSVHASKQWEANCKHESETKVAGATQSKFKDSDTPQFQLPGKLPAHLWMRIICLAEDAYDLTSSEQQLSLFNFARSSTTIMMEREILGKLTSFQIRRVLESVKALAYEV